MDQVKDVVKEQYGAAARSDLSSKEKKVRLIAEAFGYSSEELESIPAEANMGLSCGNPTAMASLRPGEVVLDLGCGGGLDVFLAARKVGPNGKAIGIDMTADMLQRAQRNARKTALENVEFYLGEIESLPLPDQSVDCVISNCVLNLVPDKPKAFREIYRVIKPGGRLAISDIALKKELPIELSEDVLAYVGCIAGAMRMEEYETSLRAAGFAAVQVIDSKADLNAYAQSGDQSACCSSVMAEEDILSSSPKGEADGLRIVEESCCSPSNPDLDLHARFAELLRKYDLNEYAASVKVFAAKNQ